jgi:hypothetical protein
MWWHFQKAFKCIHFNSTFTHGNFAVPQQHIIDLVTMAFPHKHVLLIGATSGIGKGLADRLIKDGVKVTAVGRRQDKLNAFVNQHDKTKAKAVAFDVTNLEQTPKFVAE